MASLTRDRMLSPAGSGDAVSIAAPLLALALGAVAMGVSPIFVRIAAPEVGPFASAFWRVALALPCLYGWMRLEEGRGRRVAVSGRATPAILAGLAFSGDLVFWHLAILGTSVANATFFATTAPVFVVLLTWLVLRRRVAPATLGALALCMLGGAILIGQSLAISPDRIRGDLYGIVTAVFFALYFLFVSRARESGGAGRVVFISSLVTAAVLLVVALLFDGARIWPRTGGVWAALLALALVSHVGGQGLLAVALGRLPAVFSSLVIFLEALAAALAAWAILGEAITPLQGAGGALILLGIWMARPRKAVP
ncbi:DMT family transporter [uncultured Enterovirga sp.]|uniref:DMT family transporter n=1 Tax=uncultured Enterovirga sp. TaxID=2026352 RepID=UPI0035C9A385